MSITGRLWRLVYCKCPVPSFATNKVFYVIQMLSVEYLYIGLRFFSTVKIWPEVKCRLRTCVPDLRTSEGLGLVLGFMLKVRVWVRVSRLKIKVRVSSSILPYCWSSGPFYPLPQNLIKMSQMWTINGFGLG